MAQAIENKGVLPAEISSKLGSLRRKINLWLIVNGLARLLLAVVVLLAVDFVIDRFFEMDLAQRMILMILIGVALLVILFWGLIRPFTSTTRDDALVLTVEEKHKGLKESLISAVQFSRNRSLQHQGVSQAMVDETIRHGTEQAKSIPFGSILNQEKFMWNLVLLLLSVGVLGFGAFKIAQHNSDLAIWFNRNILMGDREYPKDTYLYFPQIEGDSIVIARGENFPLLVAVDEARSNKKDVDVVLDYVDSGEKSTQTMRRKTTRSAETQQIDSSESKRVNTSSLPGDESEKDANSEAKTADSSQQQGDQKQGEKKSDDAKTKTSVKSDDEKSGDEVVSEEFVFERVFQNVNSEFKFRARGGDAVTRWITVKLVEPPAATDLQINVTPPGYTRMEPFTLEGSGPHSLLKGSSISLIANANKPLGQAVLENPAGAEIDLLNDENDPLRLSADIPTEQLLAGKYRFMLVDTQGLTTSKPTSFDIKIRTDRPPVVRARLQGVSGLVVSRALVPISANIRDDFAITGAKVGYNWKGDSGDSVAQTGEIEFKSITDDEIGKDQLLIDPLREQIDLEPLEIPAGAALRFVVSATDNDIISGPNQGDSTEFLLRIVSEDEMRTDLLRRETEQRQEFERLLKEQRDLLTESESMAADSPEDVKDVERYYSEKRKDLIAFKRRQKLVGTNLSNVADRFQEFLIESLNNRLEDSSGTVRRRLFTGIIEPMRALTNDDLGLAKVAEAVVQLELSRRVVQDDQNWQPAIDAVVNEQSKIVAEMEKILLQMAKQESFQEAVNLLRAIEKAEAESMTGTKKAKADRLKRVFETGGDDKDNEKDSTEEGDEATDDSADKAD